MRKGILYILGVVSLVCIADLVCVLLLLVSPNVNATLGDSIINASATAAGQLEFLTDTNGNVEDAANGMQVGSNGGVAIVGSDDCIIADTQKDHIGAYIGDLELPHDSAHQAVSQTTFCGQDVLAREDDVKDFRVIAYVPESDAYIYMYEPIVFMAVVFLLFSGAFIAVVAMLKRKEAQVEAASSWQETFMANQERQVNDRRTSDRRQGDRRDGDRRQGDRRQGERRLADRRQSDIGRTPDRRQGDRRQEDRRRGDRRQADRRTGDRRQKDRRTHNGRIASLWAQDVNDPVVDDTQSQWSMNMDK
jgi:hypothetical protein